MAKQKSILTILKEEVSADMISKTKTGTFMFRRGYFYRTFPLENFVNRVENNLKQLGFIVTLVDSGDHWAPFKGGAGVKANSHYYAEFSIKEPS